MPSVILLKPPANEEHVFSVGREHKMQAASGDFLNKTMLLREFRLAMLGYWLTLETAGTARETVPQKPPSA